MKQTYMDQLTRTARWRLPPAEAREVLEDYQDLLAQDPRSEEALRREVGEPVEVVRQLEQGKSYRRWLAAFALMAACLLLPALGALLNGLSSLCMDFGLFLTGLDGLWTLLNGHGLAVEVQMITLLLGLGLALWLRPQGMREGPLPKGVLPLLLVQLLGIVAFWLLFWQIATIPSGSWLTSVTYGQARALHTGLRVLLFLLALPSFPALVRFRMADRRWLAVYVLGLTVTVLGVAVLALLSSLNLDVTAPGWWMPVLPEYFVITGLGLVGTGVSLC